MISDGRSATGRPVGVGEYRVSADEDDVLVAPDVGSTIAIALYDPAVRVAGLLHFGLDNGYSEAPSPAGGDGRCGLDAVVRTVAGLGAEEARLVVRVAGGASIEGAAQMAKRNYLAVRKSLWKTGLLVDREEIGGDFWRRVAVEVGTGHISVEATTSGFPG